MPDILSFLPSATDATIIFTQIMQVVVTLGIVAAVAFFLKRKKVFYKFPVDVMIFKIMNDGKLRAYDTDKVRRVHEQDNEEYFDVKKRGFKWYPPTFEAQLLKSDGKRTMIFVKELSHNNWEIMKPEELIGVDIDGFKKMQDENTIRFWKTVEDEKADIKWAKDNIWDQLKNWMPTILMIVGLGVFIWLFGSSILIPTMNTASAINTQTVEVLEKAANIMERSTEYLEILLFQSNSSYVPSWVNRTNESVIA